MAYVGGFLALFVVAGFAVLVAYLSQSSETLTIPADGYWGPKELAEGAPFPKDSESVEKFTIVYDDKLVAGLREELARTKWFDPLPDAAYHYGVNLKTFRNVIDYWRTKFDFAKDQKQINAFPHYKTEIEGLKIHFFRSVPQTTANVKVIPLLMIHGWPGSFVEFLKVAPRLSKAVEGVAFDIIVPSLPGYGFSDPARKQGMDVVVTARIFNKLMKRLGYSKYYVQGGDWGSAVATALAALYPEELRGIHLNMAFVESSSFESAARQLLFTVLPGIFGDGEMPDCMIVPFSKRLLDVLRETGYMHIQGTKPDTVGFGLLNSAAGLAAYLSEKFSTWTQDDFRNLDDGGHGKKFSLDDILSNVMVYYASGSIISSQRYYRENFASELTMQLTKVPIHVPTGYAVFPNEIMCVPKFVLANTYKNLTTVTYQKDGGHFAAFEQPEMLEKDVRLFVRETEKLFPEELRPPTGFAGTLK